MKPRTYRRKTASGAICATMMLTVLVVSIPPLWHSPVFLLSVMGVAFAAMVGVYFDGPAASISVSAADLVVANPLRRMTIPLSAFQGWSYDYRVELLVAGHPEGVDVSAFSIGKPFRPAGRYLKWQQAKVEWVGWKYSESQSSSLATDTPQWETRRGHTALIIFAAVVGIAGLIVIASA